MLRFVWLFILCVLPLGALAADPLATVDGYRDFRAMQMAALRRSMPNMPGELFPWAARQRARYEAEMALEDEALEGARQFHVDRLDDMAAFILKHEAELGGDSAREVAMLLGEERDVFSALTELSMMAVAPFEPRTKSAIAGLMGKLAEFNLDPVQAADAYLLSYDHTPDAGTAQSATTLMAEVGMLGALKSLGDDALARAEGASGEERAAYLTLAIEVGKSLNAAAADKAAMVILTKALNALADTPFDAAQFRAALALGHSEFRAGELERAAGTGLHLIEQVKHIEDLPEIDKASAYVLASKVNTWSGFPGEGALFARDAVAMLPPNHPLLPAALEAQAMAARTSGDLAGADEAFIAARGISLPAVLPVLTAGARARLAGVHADLLEEMGDIPRAREARRAQLDHLDPPEGAEARAEIEAHIARLSGQ